MSPGVKGQPGCNAWHNEPSSFMPKECGHVAGRGRCFSLRSLVLHPEILVPQTKGELKIALGLFLAQRGMQPASPVAPVELLTVQSHLCPLLIDSRAASLESLLAVLMAGRAACVSSFPTAQICMASSPTAEYIPSDLCLMPHRPGVGGVVVQLWFTVYFAPQQAGGAQLEEGSSSGHEATGRMERPVASVQVSQETVGVGVPTPRPSAPQALGLLCLCVQLLQVGAPPSCVG